MAKKLTLIILLSIHCWLCWCVVQGVRHGRFIASRALSAVIRHSYTGANLAVEKYKETNGQRLKRFSRNIGVILLLYWWSQVYLATDELEQILGATSNLRRTCKEHHCLSSRLTD